MVVDELVRLIAETGTFEAQTGITMRSIGLTFLAYLIAFCVFVLIIVVAWHLIQRKRAQADHYDRKWTDPGFHG